MSFAELVLIVGLVGLALAIGFLVGRSSRQLAGCALAVSVPVASGAVATMPGRSCARAPLVASAIAKPSAALEPRALLASAESWGYQLQDLDVAQASASPFDVLVIDHAFDGTGDTALTPAEVARLKRKPCGGRRLVLAHLSVGEAESYRFYWREEWSRDPPDWLIGESPDWDETYAVRFWHPGWRALLRGDPGAYLDRVLAQGFDGICLDRCDVVDGLGEREHGVATARADLDADMVSLIVDLAGYARAQQPGFVVVMQNAEALLARPDLRQVVDAVVKEELLYGLDGAEVANDGEDVRWSVERLDLMRKDGKPVLVVEYLDDAAKIAMASKAARKLGYFLYVSPASRDLDRLVLPLSQA